MCPSKKDRGRLYNQEKRNLRFNDKWLAEYPWLEYELEGDKMYCKLCKKYPNMSGGLSRCFVFGSSRSSGPENLLTEYLKTIKLTLLSNFSLESSSQLDSSLNFQPLEVLLVNLLLKKYLLIY